MTVNTKIKLDKVHYGIYFFNKLGCVSFCLLCVINIVNLKKKENLRNKILVDKLTKFQKISSQNKLNETRIKKKLNIK